MRLDSQIYIQDKIYVSAFSCTQEIQDSLSDLKNMQNCFVKYEKVLVFIPVAQNICSSSQSEP